MYVTKSTLVAFVAPEAIRETDISEKCVKHTYNHGSGNHNDESYTPSLAVKLRLD